TAICRNIAPRCCSASNDKQRCCDDEASSQAPRPSCDQSGPLPLVSLLHQPRFLVPAWMILKAFFPQLGAFRAMPPQDRLLCVAPPSIYHEYFGGRPVTRMLDLASHVGDPGTGQEPCWARQVES